VPTEERRLLFARRKMKIAFSDSPNENSVEEKEEWSKSTFSQDKCAKKGGCPLVIWTYLFIVTAIVSGGLMKTSAHFSAIQMDGASFGR
jgi:hypothetical protein